MLCEEGHKLKVDLAGASIRLSSDYAPREARLIPERLEVERLHLAQHDTLNDFIQHVGS